MGGKGLTKFPFYSLAESFAAWDEREGQFSTDAGLRRQNIYEK